MVGVGGMAEYRKEQERLRDLIAKQRQTSQKLSEVEDRISQLETNYLDATPSGNIIVGFDSYIKGINAAQRKRLAAPDQNRLFSRSSVSYKPNSNTESTNSGSTTGAPTPTFKNDSNNHTPTSATHPPGAGRAGKKKKPVVQEDDSEVEAGPSNSRKRINFGAGRK